MGEHKKCTVSNYLEVVAICIGICICCYIAYKSGYLGEPLWKAETIEEQEFTQKSRLMKDSKGKVYELNQDDAFTHGINAKIRGEQFNSEYSRFWMTLKNTTGKDLHILAGINQAVLLVTDDQEHPKMYKVDPLATTNPSIIPAGAEADIELYFDPIPEESKHLSLKLPSVFFMDGTKSFNIAFDFNSF